MLRRDPLPTKGTKKRSRCTLSTALRASYVGLGSGNKTVMFTKTKIAAATTGTPESEEPASSPARQDEWQQG